jgi:intracellular sulfur oxidation DsrE/DsrF family protein
MRESNGQVPPRRGFLGQVAGALAALGVPGLVTAQGRGAPLPTGEAWPERLTGRHKVIIQSHEPAEGVAFAWATNFLNAQRDAYGLADRDSSVVIGLQGKALAMYLDDAMWAKYGMAPALGFPGPGNPFRAPAGAMTLAALQARGVILLACGNTLKRGATRWVKDRAITPEVAAAWEAEARAALAPGVEVVPAMVTTLVMAQERGCRYIYAG